MADSDEDLKQLKQDYQITFSSKEGERVLADITSAYYHRGSYTKNDSYETSYREGQRSVIIRIINLMKENKNG
jgi:prolyl oligopeptidase PreP (S9A serine peptidase family)